MDETIEVGFHAFASGAQEEFGAVRDVFPEHKQVVVYIENAGDHVLPMDAVVSVRFQKVIFDVNRLEPHVRNAIQHAHDAEDSPTNR